MRDETSEGGVTVSSCLFCSYTDKNIGKLTPSELTPIIQIVSIKLFEVLLYTFSLTSSPFTRAVLSLCDEVSDQGLTVPTSLRKTERLKT